MEEQPLTEIKEMGAALMSTVDQIPFYGALYRVGIFRLPSRSAVLEAAQEINGIVARMGASQPMDAIENMRALKKIAGLLGVRTTYGRPQVRDGEGA
jgi:hypothetical protein